MRKKSIAQIEAQIAKLTAEAEQIRAQEVAEVIERLKGEIAAYGLTAADLGLDGAIRKGRRASTKAAAPAAESKPAKKRRSAKAEPSARKTSKKSSKAASKAKYSDGENSWTGVGKRPNWFKAAIEAGKTPEDLLV